jgi:hypothetical protein
VRVAVLKLKGVESADVSLQFKTADIRLRPENRVTLTELRRIIKDAGFSAKEATIAAVGTLVERGGKPALQLAGLNTVLLLAGDSSKPDPYKEVVRRLGARDTGTIEIAGVVNPPSTATEPEELIVESVTFVR